MKKRQPSRSEFQEIAQARVDDAKVLLDQGRWDAAYYLTGYAVECGLKSCVIRRLMATDEFPDINFSKDCYTHKLAQLLELAGLESVLTAANRNVQDKWLVVKDWKEEVRYALMKPADAQGKAEQLDEAVTDAGDGVLPWIKNYW